MATNDDIEVRPLTEEEIDRAWDLMQLTFAGDADDELRAAETSVIEPARTLGAFDGGVLIGCAAAFSFDMSVPGASIPVAGTTWIAVGPTHRRRGVLRLMMDRHLADIADGSTTPDGYPAEPIAALWASEPAIYGRFGYGQAAEQDTLTVTLGDGLSWRASAPPPPERVRLVPPAEAARLTDSIYEAARSRRPGMHARDARWWSFQALGTHSGARIRANIKYVAVGEIAGADAVYAIYGLKESWNDQALPQGHLEVQELVGVDARSEAAMWRYLCEHDLTTTVGAYRRPVDDPLPLLITNPRRVKRVPIDSLHVRIIDLPAALAARSYAGSDTLVVEVADARFPGNDGRWRLDLSPTGAGVSRTADTPDLRMDVREMGALYLGGTSAVPLAAAGLIECGDDSTLRRLDRLFAADEAVFAPEIW